MPETYTFMRSLSVTARCSMRYREEKLKAEGLTGGQCHYLLAICAQPGISQDKLTRALYVNKSSASRQLASLEQSGYITRASDQNDRRALRVYPTDKALAALPKVRAVLREWKEQLLCEFDESEKEALASLLDRLRQKAVFVIDGLNREGEA